MSSGFVIIHKQAGPTSHDVVNVIRRLTGVRKVGHAGTLDPFATGLLIVGVGREATRELHKITGLDKQYRGVVRLGATSTTDDRTGKISPLPEAQLGEKSPQIVVQAINKFVGKIQQTPPVYSAKKIAGKKMYELARAGKIFQPQAAAVEIYEIKMIDYHWPLLTVDVRCSSGTYIRALARDLGAELGTGGYLEELERTAIGPYQLTEAVKLNEITLENASQWLIPVEKFLRMIA